MSHYGNISDPLNNCVISFGVGGLDIFWQQFYQVSSHGMSANGKITKLFFVSIFLTAISLGCFWCQIFVDGQCS